MITCPKCGAENEDDKKFCGDCGEKLISLNEDAQVEEVEEVEKTDVVEKKTLPKKRKKSFKRTVKNITKKAKLVGIVIVVILVLIGCYAIYSKFSNNSGKSEGQGVFKGSDISETIVHDELLKVGEFATGEYTFTDAISVKNSKKIKSWKIPFTSKQYFIKYNGVVKAGYDVSSIDIELQEDSKEVSIILPNIKIFDCYIDSQEIIDEKDTVFNQTKLQDDIDIQNYVKTSLRLNALENGILPEASDYAMDLIYDTIKYVVPKDWEVFFYYSDKSIEDIEKEMIKSAEKENKKYKEMYDIK